MIEDEKPDIVCLGGDIFDDKLPDENAEALLSGISGKYPLYYVTGNHEYTAGDEAFAERIAMYEKYGVVRLDNENRIIEVKGQKINLCGINDQESYYGLEEEMWYYFSRSVKKVSSELDPELFTLFLTHRPDSLWYYKDFKFDLILSGHAHGGQWQIPYFLENGLYAPPQGTRGFFPKMTNGKFVRDGVTMIVSRGLAKNSIVPRLYNTPRNRDHRY